MTDEKRLYLAEPEKVIGGVKFEKVGGVRAGKRGGHEDQKERRVDFSGRIETLIPCE